MEDKVVMTVKQIAEYLPMDEHTIYKLASSGQIHSLKIADQWRFKKDVIDKWISEESLERVAENIKSSSKKKGKEKIIYG
ncbi:MAG TPA: helix-turn-helix domain-containing protein [bacterium]|nr:helix-turn-helix domain-containing protein [bacterium]HPQ18926.1 helix-turn-helix domain-containing protein [bacterium]